MARRRPRGWHRQVRRKFVWDRTRGFASVPMLMVLISGQLQKSAWRNAFGRNCHSDSWYVWPDAVGGRLPPALSRRCHRLPHRRME